MMYVLRKLKRRYEKRVGGREPSSPINRYDPYQFAPYFLNESFSCVESFTYRQLSCHSFIHSATEILKNKNGKGIQRP